MRKSDTKKDNSLHNSKTIVNYRNFLKKWCQNGVKWCINSFI